VPFSATRDLWLVLKARDEATSAMRAFSRDIRQVGDSVAEANLRAARSAIQNEVAARRLSAAYQIGILRKGEQTDATKAEISALQNETRAFALGAQQRIGVIDQEIASMRVQRSQMEENRVSSQKLSSAFAGLSAATAAMGTVMVASAAFGVAGLYSLVKAQSEYEKASALTRTQVDKFATSLEDIEKIGLRVADSIGVPFEQIQPALYNIFSSMEIGAKQAEQVLGIFAKAAVAGQTSIENASVATIGILNAFQLPLTSINHLMDVQFQLVKEGIGSYDEWSQRIGLVTPSAVRFGQTVDMMTAALAASTRMGISAARSATAVSRAMDAMSNPAAVKALKGLGIASYDASGHFRPMIDILMDFRTQLEKMPNQDRVKAILDVFKGAGGTIEARRFLQNMLLTPGNLELFQNILGSMKQSAGSFEQAYAIMADTTAIKTELLANKWQEVKIAAGKALVPAFTAVVSWFIKLFDWFNKLPPSTQQLIVKIIAITVAVTGLIGVLLLITSVILGFAAAITVASTPVLLFVGIAALVVGAIIAIGVAFTILMIKNKGFRDWIINAGKNIKNFALMIAHGFMAAVNAVIDFGKMIIQAVVTAWNAVVNATVTAWNAVVSFVQTVVGAIVGFVQGLINGMISVFQAGINFIVGIWNYFWNTSIGGLIISAGKFLLAVAELTLYGLLFIFEYIIKGIQIAWDFLWDHVIKYVVDAWNIVVAYLSGVWETVKGAALAAWNLVYGYISDKVNSAKTAVMTAFNIVKSFLDTIWTNIKTAVAAAWETVKSTVGEKVDAVVNKAKEVKDKIVNFFANAGTWLFEAGKHIIQGLIDGIGSMFDALGNKISDAANWIKSHLPFSPAKRGPLSGRGNPYYSGQSIVKLIAAGIYSQQDALTMALNAFTGNITNMTGGLAIGNAAGGTGTTGTHNQYNQSIVINTNEIDPRRHAMELGALLAGVS